MVGKRAFQRPDSSKGEYNAEDLESGFRQRRFPRFKDAVDFAVAERTTALLKKQLRAGVDTEVFEKYRKGDEEVSMHVLG